MGDFCWAVLLVIFQHHGAYPTGSIDNDLLMLSDKIIPILESDYLFPLDIIRYLPIDFPIVFFFTWRVARKSHGINGIDKAIYAFQSNHAWPGLLKEFYHGYGWLYVI